MARLYNLARMTTATTGTGTITLGSAVSGFLSFASAGIADGETVTYAIKDGANSEIGRGVYTSSGTTLTRSVMRSTNSDTPISLSGAAQVFITAAAEDFEPRVNAQTGTSYTILSSDFGKTLTLSNASAIAITLPQATGAFASGWHCVIVNIDSSTATITPTTSLIAGAATFTLNRGQACEIVSDGTNWIVLPMTGLRGAVSTVASASTCDIGSVASDRVSVTGTTTITSFGTTPNVIRFVSFTGALTLTHNATSLILPRGANITTVAGDGAIFSSDSSGNWRCLAFLRITAEPAFSAYRNGNQTGVSTTTWTKVQLNAESFDTNSNFDSATNYRFTPTVAGYYVISATATLSGTSMTYPQCSIYKNGSAYAASSYSPVTVSDAGMTSNTVVYMNGSTDYVELYIIGVVGSGTVTVNGGNPSQTTMSGCLLQRA